MIHPDFRIKDPEGFWWWNYTDFGEYARRAGKKFSLKLKKGIIKIAFPFDDPALLDGCIFMCKIGENQTSKPDTKWFGVAYGFEDDADKLAEWASRFPRSELIKENTFGGGTKKFESLEQEEK